MSPQGHVAEPPSRKWLLGASLAAMAGASAIVTLFVLPAEFRIDPTGFGRATGLLSLAGPKVPAAGEAARGEAGIGDGGAVARYSQSAFHSDVIEIPLRRLGGELEYKVRMKAGDGLVYSWRVEQLPEPDLLYYDFHGESRDLAKGQEPVVEEYRQRTGDHDAGVLIPSLSGVHGWFFQNSSEKPVTVRLRLSGFYELVPPGEYGNEAGIAPTPASKD